MASRDNQGLQIAVMSFALGFVLLAVTTYVGFKQYGDERKENEQLTQSLTNERTAHRKLQEDANRFKEMMGLAAEDERDEIESTFSEDIKRYADTFPEEKQYYRPVIEYLHNELHTIAQREADAIDNMRKSDEHWKKEQADMNKLLAEYRQQLDEANKDLASEQAGYAKERERIQANLDKLANELKTRRDEYEVTLGERQETIKDFTAKTNELESLNSKLADEKRELVKGTFDVADGRIVRAEQGSRSVWVNLGSADGLIARTTFSVYDHEESNAATAEVKAKIQVTQILDDHLAEARVLTDTASDPIARRDQIYSPVWHPGRRQSFALAGFIDIDGDRRSDEQTVIDLIKANGGVIDARIGEDGEVDGQITINTKFLITGDEPKVSGDNQQVKATVDNAILSYSSMTSRSQNLGVEQISVGEFLDRMGWLPTDRTIALGTGTKSADFIPKTERGVERFSKPPVEKFPKRRKLRTTY